MKRFFISFLAIVAVQMPAISASLNLNAYSEGQYEAQRQNQQNMENWQRAQIIQHQIDRQQRALQSQRQVEAEQSIIQKKQQLKNEWGSVQPQPGRFARWIMVMNSNEGYAYIDKDSITKNGSDITFFSRYSKENTSSMINRISVRCSERRYAILSWAFYDVAGNFTSGLPGNMPAKNIEDDSSYIKASTQYACSFNIN